MERSPDFGFANAAVLAFAATFAFADAGRTVDYANEYAQGRTTYPSAQETERLVARATEGEMWAAATEDIQFAFNDGTEEQAPVIEEAPADGPSLEEISEMMDNPLGHLWIVWTQFDYKVYDGRLSSGSRNVYSYRIMPVMPVQLTDEWKVILRPNFGFTSADVPKGFDITDGQPEGPPTATFGRENGLADTVLMMSFSKWTKPPFVVGFGPTFMFPTATQDELGTEKWSAGPSFLAIYIGEIWKVGTIVQHWSSFAGNSSRDHVNLTDIQYIVRYTIDATTNVGFAPNITYDWSSEDWTIPVGIGFEKTMKLGPGPVRVGLEYHYYVEQPNAFGPEHGIRFTFTPVIPAPGWAKSPLFQN